MHSHSNNGEHRIEEIRETEMKEKQTYKSKGNESEEMPTGEKRRRNNSDLIMHSVAFEKEKKVRKWGQLEGTRRWKYLGMTTLTLFPSLE